ncbi:unnamed protein product [Caenorhabditis nigoni]|uniref:DUF38 domain-containing protein n=1 Tax=Caenorhabditis nigoni TaxID=1611254 RepID=A0A2G5SHQ4_9PELO|nr:hypothetical protein B9Z55_026884 [Caenorhabditis nigoni]
MSSFQQIFDTEQFKQAKHIDIASFVADNKLFLFNFRHLNSFKLRILTPVPDNLFRNLRHNIPLYYKSFETCELSIIDFENRFRIRSIGEALGEEIPFGPLNTITHPHRIPKSNEYLEFEIKDEGCRCRVKIVKVR